MTLETANNQAPAPELASVDTSPRAPRYELPEELEAITGQPETKGEEVAETPVDDTEEIEIEGKKYRDPKDLKDGYLRQSDYTQKTQSLAEQRRQVEAQAAQIAERAAADDAQIQRVAALHLVDAQLGMFPKNSADWSRLEQQDPARAASLFRQFQELRQTKDSLSAQSSQYQQQRSLESQRARATQAEASIATLKSQIPDFSAQTLQDIEAFAVKEFGFSPEQIRSVVEPGPWIMAYKLMNATNAAKAEVAEAAKPEPVVVKPVSSKPQGQSRATNELSDSDDIETWNRKRDAQLRARYGR